MPPGEASRMTRAHGGCSGHSFEGTFWRQCNFTPKMLIRRIPTEAGRVLAIHTGVSGHGYQA